MKLIPKIKKLQNGNVVFPIYLETDVIKPEISLLSSLELLADWYNQYQDYKIGGNVNAPIAGDLIDLTLPKGPPIAGVLEGLVAGADMYVNGLSKGNVKDVVLAGAGIAATASGNPFAIEIVDGIGLASDVLENMAESSLISQAKKVWAELYLKAITETQKSGNGKVVSFDENSGNYVMEYVVPDYDGSPKVVRINGIGLSKNPTPKEANEYLSKIYKIGKLK